MIHAPPETPYSFLSLGAGVQSSAMALMAAKGLIEPMPDAAIFADTQAEPQSVYKWLDWLEGQLPFPVHRVSAGSLTDMALKMKKTPDGRLFSRTAVPVHTLTKENVAGMVGHRSCTRDFKIRPLTKAARQLAGIKRGQKEITVTQWIGISWDEIQRVKPSREPWQQCRWPLIEMRLERRHLLEWMSENGYPEPPRSACYYCPFHSDREWRRLRDEEPEEFAKAIKFEKDLQAAKKNSDNFDSTPFLHKSCQPLDEVDFSTDTERGQELLGFMQECEGMCGL